MAETWSQKPYRGETSLNLPEMLGLTNIQVLAVVGFTAAVVIVAVLVTRRSQV